MVTVVGDDLVVGGDCLISIGNIIITPTSANNTVVTFVAPLSTKISTKMYFDPVSCQKNNDNVLSDLHKEIIAI